MFASATRNVAGLAEVRGLTARRTLLVVDDELGPRQSLRMVFKDDYEVLLAESGEKALELVRAHTVHAAILDIRMTGMSGVEVLERLKQRDPTIEVIMLTAYETIETARQALKHGACDYLTKPFDLETMRAAVAHAMDRHSLSQQREASLRRLRELQEELRNQRIQEEIIRAKGEIYASVLHDINGPLIIISGFVDIINSRIEGVSAVEGEGLELIRDRLARVTRQVNNCIDISQRYLSFLRRPDQAGVTVSLRQVLRDVEELLRVHPSLRDNDLQVELPDEEITAEINGASLIQMVLNLAINGLQASPEPHEVRIRCHRLEIPLDLDRFVDGPQNRLVNREGFRNTAPLAVISVVDTGLGIRPAVLDEVFQPRTFGDYFSTKNTQGGTGLGMAIVQRFIREGEGALQVETCVGEGSRFTAYFPAQVPVRR
jgi:two-component system, sensor histidine kinase and response regulator